MNGKNDARIAKAFDAMVKRWPIGDNVEAYAKIVNLIRAEVREELKLAVERIRAPRDFELKSR